MTRSIRRTSPSCVVEREGLPEQGEAGAGLMDWPWAVLTASVSGPGGCMQEGEMQSLSCRAYLYHGARSANHCIDHTPSSSARVHRDRCGRGWCEPSPHWWVLLTEQKEEWPALCSAHNHVRGKGAFSQKPLHHPLLYCLICLTTKGKDAFELGCS